MGGTDIMDRFISQYKDKKGKKNIRGKRVEFNPEILTEISKSAQRIAEDEDVYAPKEVQRILKFIENGGHLCQFHKQFGIVHESCKICKSLRAEN